MRITNSDQESSSFSNFSPNPSLQNRINSFIPYFFYRNSVNERFEKKFIKNMDAAVSNDTTDLLKKVITLYKRNPQNKKIFKVYKNFLKEREQLLIKAIKPIRTKEQADKALEIISRTVHLVDRYGKQQIEQYKDNPKKVDQLYKEQVSIKSFLYSIRERVDTKYFLPVEKLPSQLRFNANFRVHTFAADDTLKAMRKRESESHGLMADLDRDYIKEQKN